MQLYSVLKRPLMSEKSTTTREDTQAYTFEVAEAATKTDIKKAIETMFEVNVVNVRTSIKRAGPKRQQATQQRGRPAHIKKAFVALKKDQKIKIFEDL